ncbi:aminodeoxychorismate lyase [Yersinia pseudotuberculosis IP 32953]|uniref:Aminodeoxychorismate lyase n=4 Tax=Yersinia pseudotuberculosis complex TaxID=1649845 RepID=Q669L6_YERPS|nr:aminodeoxychorismate lyase [Yersinia pseudotuberculosis]CQD58160.1 4-amino-4-deoxychorismate lyase [Yersinia intermedia]AJJ01123.1 aminodeoxychorismate lyase [Yersinia pseudotuberculosis]AJJ53548.1 aminodeoxychorismate lyase [Yersinia pseudotuberculosis IP 32953]AJJ58229.1 aminodeoxychorismate lyase [Yersinia pseudotuberculosis YPIII]AJJ68129.1 aminodeoxychorismate lyase [Yersinia pseudotuberculosis PB1/+]
MFWINGVEQNLISASDRSVQFGDGCFTTARVSDGRVVWLDQHVLRLQRATERLLLPTVNWKILTKEMVEAASHTESGVLKVIISRGSGGRGYSGTACQHPTRIISLSGYPAHYSTWRDRGISLALSPVPLARNPLLAGIKHLNRLEQVLIRAHLEQTEAEEAVVLDTAGQLVECCAANLFWRKGNQVCTPDLSHSGVDGIMRQRIIACLAAHNMPVEIVVQPLNVLADADEVIVCNALMPVLPVNKVGKWVYKSRVLFDLLNLHCCDI